MEQSLTKIGFGGGCHWCTEAIFLSIRGVHHVNQGWIASTGQESSFSEAVIAHFDHTIVALSTLIHIHLFTHSCTSNHSLRSKYRSAVYTFFDDQITTARDTIRDAQQDYSEPIITQVFPYEAFRLNEALFLNYYYNQPDRPFCRNVIDPKLRELLRVFSKEVDTTKLGAL